MSRSSSICRPALIHFFEDALGILECVSDGALPRWAWLGTYFASYYFRNRIYTQPDLTGFILDRR